MNFQEVDKRDQKSSYLSKLQKPDLGKGKTSVWTLRFQVRLNHKGLRMKSDESDAEADLNIPLWSKTTSKE
jgi:hypothetical protein